MQKVILILAMGLLLSGNAYACGLGWFVGSIFDFTKEHRVCAEYARNVPGDEWKKNNAYCDCRERLQLEKYKVK